ncbi:DUF3861 domain-containing protein [Yersinia aldovae]|uniref:DUF3861 domain-containing protein n=1 Tax=Yersinia aldovae TaxID=29483 RepID=UPI0005AC4B05|nr:DUF3861 domain-containing protein [Yersinia aldovae]AJJ61530.1 hypothetical protein AT01_3692 [Yersinia aldovae 670-83]
MPGYRYRITIEPLTDRKGAAIDKAPVTFEAENHDEILSIIERLQAREDLDFGKEKTAAFALGLKLFSETMMENRTHPLFASLGTSFKDFMFQLKKGPTHNQHESSK